MAVTSAPPATTAATEIAGGMGATATAVEIADDVDATADASARLGTYYYYVTQQVATQVMSGTEIFATVGPLIAYTYISQHIYLHTTYNHVTSLEGCAGATCGAHFRRNLGTAREGHRAAQHTAPSDSAGTVVVSADTPEWLCGPVRHSPCRHQTIMRVGERPSYNYAGPTHGTSSSCR